MHDWTPRRRIEEMFRRELFRLVNRHLAFPDHATMGEISETLANFKAISTTLGDYAHTLASQMVGAVEISNARSWREAASPATRSGQTYKALRGELRGKVGNRREELIRENAQVISSLPGRLRDQVAAHIGNMQIRGERPEAIAKQIVEGFPGVAKSRCTLIARTETSKAATELTRARSEDLSLDWYIWQTSGDQRVRRSHSMIDGVLVNWSDPPSPESLAREKSEGRYHAGEIFNCRCDPIPFVGYRQIDWPHKVHISGVIKRLTLRAFDGQYGLKQLGA
jgi:SPP1 gp7 family putative phage head morphogenesis protein